MISGRWSLIALVLLAGCTTPSRQASGPTPAPTVALAVRIVGGGAPTPLQMNNAHQAMATYLSRAGYRLAPNFRTADLIVTVDFTPDPVDPAGGRVAIATVEPGVDVRRSLATGGETDEAREFRRRAEAAQAAAAAEPPRP